MKWLLKAANERVPDNLFDMARAWYESERRPEYEQEEVVPRQESPDLIETRGEEVHKAMELIERWRQKSDEHKDLSRAIKYLSDHPELFPLNMPDSAEKKRKLWKLREQTEREKDDLQIHILHLNDQIRMIAEEELGPYGYDEVLGQSRAITYLDLFMNRG